MVLGREMPGQESYRCEGRLTGGEQIERDGELAARACDLDAGAGRVLGETQRLLTVREERTVSLRGVDVRPRIESGQVGDEIDRRITLSLCEGVETGEEVLIGESGRESEGVR